MSKDLFLADLKQVEEVRDWLQARLRQWVVNVVERFSRRGNPREAQREVVRTGPQEELIV